MKMKKLVILMAAFAIALNTGLAFAQTPARPTPQTAPTNPSVTPPAAPQTTTPITPTAFTISGMTPNSVVSAASDYPKLVSLRGANLDKINIGDLKLSDGSTDLTLALADQPIARSASLTATIPANAKGEFVLSVGGIDTAHKLVIKDADQAAAEKAEADRKRAEAAAKAAAARAAAEAKTLRTDVAALKNEITALKTTVGTDNGQGGKIASLESANTTLTARVEALEAKVNAPMTGLNALGGRVVNLEQVDQNQNTAIGAVAAVVINGGKKTEKEAVRELLARLGVAIVDKK